MVDIFDELSESTRRRLLYSLSLGSKSVNELADDLGLKQPNVSNHLARLRAKGMVRAVKQGRQVLYHLNGSRIERIVRELGSGVAQGSESKDLHALAKTFAIAAVSADSPACEKVIDEAILQGASLESIFDVLITGALYHVGDWYVRKEITVAQEHIASQVADRMVGRASSYFYKAKSSGLTALLGCGPGNWHSIGIRMIADFLHLDGWRAVSTGANTPVESFLSTTQELSPDLILISCIAEGTFEATQDLITQVIQAWKSPKPLVLGAGGAACIKHKPELEALGVSFVCGSVRELKAALSEFFEVRSEPSYQKVLGS